MSVLAALLAAAALEAQAPAAQAAETFVQACLETGGERSAVAELARTRQWEAAQPDAAAEGVVWRDVYRTPSGILTVLETAEFRRTPDARPGLPPMPTVVAPAHDQCAVIAASAIGEWPAVAAVLDASDKLIAFPEEMQPREPTPRDGIVRYYAMAPAGPGGGLVTVNENAAGGFVAIHMARPHARDDQR